MVFLNAMAADKTQTFIVVLIELIIKRLHFGSISTLHRIPMDAEARVAR